MNNWLNSSLKKTTTVHSIVFFSVIVFVQQRLATWQPSSRLPQHPHSPKIILFTSKAYTSHCWPHAKSQQWSLLGEILSKSADILWRSPCTCCLTHTQRDTSSHQIDVGCTSISCTCSSLVMYICCSESSSSLLRSRRVFPSSAAKCRSDSEQTKRDNTREP